MAEASRRLSGRLKVCRTAHSGLISMAASPSVISAAITAGIQATPSRASCAVEASLISPARPAPTRTASAGRQNSTYRRL